MSIRDTFEGVAVREKCCAMYRGSTSAVFCLRRDGHDGSHRGSRAQWTVQPRVEKLARRRAVVATS